MSLQPVPMWFAQKQGYPMSRRSVRFCRSKRLNRLGKRRRAVKRQGKFQDHKSPCGPRVKLRGMRSLASTVQDAPRACWCSLGREGCSCRCQSLSIQNIGASAQKRHALSDRMSDPLAKELMLGSRRTMNALRREPNNEKIWPQNHKRGDPYASKGVAQRMKRAWSLHQPILEARTPHV